MTEMVSADRVRRDAEPLPASPSTSFPAPVSQTSIPSASASPPSITVARAPTGADAPAVTAAPAKTSKRKRVLLVALLVIGSVGGYYGYRYWTEGRFLVSTDDAYVKADMATIAAKVGGYVQSVAVVENQRVRKGDLLASIDPVDYRLAVVAAQGRIDTQSATIARFEAQAKVQRATIDQARAGAVGAEADRTRAVSEYSRANELSLRSYGTPQRLDQARADRDRTIAAVSNAGAQVAAAEANLAVLDAQRVEAIRLRNELTTAMERAQRDLDFATIRAPFDGIVGNKSVQPGMLVQPGTRMLTLVPPQTAYVEANFKETQLGRLQLGQHAAVRLDAHADRVIDGVVESFAPASGAQFSMLPPENATGNFTKIVQRVPVRIRIPVDVASEGLLAPGLSVEVDIDVRTGPQAQGTTAHAAH